LRCIECVTEPITPGHFCECCGRKLSLEERRGLENVVPTPAVPPSAAPPVEPSAVVQPPPAAPTLCESCGAPSAETLCPTCREVFLPFLNKVPSQQPEGVSVPPTVEDLFELGDVAEAPAAGSTSPAEWPAHVADVAPVEAAPQFAAVALESPQQAAAAGPEPAADAWKQPPAPVPVEVPAPVHAPAAPAPVAAEPAPARSAEPAIAPVVASRPAPAAKPAAAPRAATPPAPAKRPASRSRRTDWMFAAAAVVAIVGAIGAGWGAFMMKAQPEAGGQPTAPSAAPAPVPVPAPVVQRPAVRDEVAEAAARVEADMAAQQRAAQLAAKAKPSSAAAVSTPRVPKTANKPVAPAPQVAAVTPARVEPVREAEPPPPAPVAAAPAPAPVATASAAPLRPFYEPSDVNEAPQIASRIEPQVPDELRGRSINDIVVVRLLVSQTGQPSSVSLLRRSKGGASLDDAVLAAVKQWTFSPARKKGEAVSCWFNVGVPVK
jgi:TonB family protein